MGPSWHSLQRRAAGTVKVKRALSANALGPSDSCGQLGCPKPSPSKFNTYCITRKQMPTAVGEGNRTGDLSADTKPSAGRAGPIL